MRYSLTTNQKTIAKKLVHAIREDGLTESFGRDARTNTLLDDEGNFMLSWPEIDLGTLTIFEKNGLIVLNSGWVGVTDELFKAVDSGFSEDPVVLPVSSIAQPHPPEIAMSIDRLRGKYPDPKALGFLVMRFAAAKPYARIVEVIKETTSKHGIAVVRADENEFHADLWGNVRTHLHGCGFGIAVYERIETDEPNANVGLEVGYLMAMNKPVLLLKDKTMETLPSDLAGRLYKVFDPHDPENTVPDQIEKWLHDNGIAVTRH